MEIAQRGFLDLQYRQVRAGLERGIVGPSFAAGAVGGRVLAHPWCGGGGKRMRKRGPEATLAEGQGLCDARYTMELGSQNNSAKGSLEASDEQSDGQRGERCPNPT